MAPIRYEKFQPLHNARLALNYLTSMVDERYDNLPFWRVAPHVYPAFAQHCRVEMPLAYGVEIGEAPGARMEIMRGGDAVAARIVIGDREDMLGQSLKPKGGFHVARLASPAATAANGLAAVTLSRDGKG